MVQPAYSPRKLPTAKRGRASTAAAPTGGASARRRRRGRVGGGGLVVASRTLPATERIVQGDAGFRFAPWLQPFLRAPTVPYFPTQTVYLTALGSQNFSPARSATSLLSGRVVTGESGFMMNPGCLISWFWAQSRRRKLG